MKDCFQFALTPGGVGLVFMGFSISYTITNPIVGVLLDYGFAPLRIVLMGKYKNYDFIILTF